MKRKWPTKSLPFLRYIALYCIATVPFVMHSVLQYVVALLMLRGIALRERNALACSCSVQLKRILDFSLGCEVARGAIERPLLALKRGWRGGAPTKCSFDIIMKHIYHVLITKIYIG